MEENLRLLVVLSCENHFEMQLFEVSVWSLRPLEYVRPKM